VTEITHNHPEGLKAAEATAMATWMALKGQTPFEIHRQLRLDFDYDLDRTVDEIRPDYHFDETCQGSVPEAIICALESSPFEDAIRNAVSLGGDADTQAAIAGPIAEGLHGIPDEMKETARRKYLEEAPDILDILARLYREDAPDYP